MKHIAAILSILLVTGCAYHMQPEIRGAELDAMVERHMAFIAENSDLEPAPVPRVEFRPNLVSLARVKMGAKVDAWMADAADIAALYDFDTQIIYLPDRWKPYADEEANLLHELVHYLQHENGVPVCRREWETQAYQLQWLWYKQNRPSAVYHMAGWQKLIPAGCE